MERRNWTREETILAFDLYCRIPFGKIHVSNQEIINLANIIGRSLSSVAMKMCNMAAHDPVQRQRGVKGLEHGCKMECAVWEEFKNDWESLAFESKRILADIEHTEIDEELSFSIDTKQTGEERECFVKQRVGQCFFRNAVLGSYNSKCCITGISINTLLIASHIKPWSCSDDKTERTNPGNGLCLNALHDKAFDKGLITIDDEYKIVVSPKLKDEEIDETTKSWIVNYEGNKIMLPNRFLPEKRFIEYHNDVVFQH